MSIVLWHCNWEVCVWERRVMMFGGDGVVEALQRGFDVSWQRDTHLVILEVPI